MGPVASVSPDLAIALTHPAVGRFTPDVFEHMFEQAGSGSRPVPEHPSGCTDLDPRAPGGDGWLGCRVGKRLTRAGYRRRRLPPASSRTSAP